MDGFTRRVDERTRHILDGLLHEPSNFPLRFGRIDVLAKMVYQGRSKDEFGSSNMCVPPMCSWGDCSSVKNIVLYASISLA
jgi:hypothetical protein